MSRPLGLNLRWIWRGILCAACVIIWIAMLWQYYGLGGTFSLTYRFTGDGQLITPFEPHGRALDLEQNLDSGDHYQRLVGEPVYFSAQLSGAYPTVDVTLEYQNPSQKIVSLGIQTNDTEPYRYTFQPLENKFVDTSTWSMVSNDRYQLFQRQPRYTTVEDFLAHPPTTHQVGTFFSPSQFPFIDPNYQADANGFNTAIPLVGPQHLTTYIKNEVLEISFDCVTPNPITLQIKHLGEVVTQQTWPETTTPARQASVMVPNLAEGVYDIILLIPDDAQITRVQSAQHKLVFRNTVRLGSSASPTTLYSNSNNLTVIPQTLAALDDIDISNGTVDTTLQLTKVGAPIEWQNPILNYPFTVTVPQNNALLIGDAALATDRSHWFDPSFGFRALAQNTTLDRLDDILTATYQSPEKRRGWTTATTTFDLTKVSRTHPNQLNFMLSAPGLDTAAQGIKVHSITVTAHKPALTWDTLWTRLRNRL